MTTATATTQAPAADLRPLYAPANQGEEKQNMSTLASSGKGSGPSDKPKVYTTNSVAHALLRYGFSPTILYPAGVVVDPEKGPESGKRPIGKGWDLAKITTAQTRLSDLSWSR